MTGDSDTRNPAPRDFTDPPALASTHSVRQKIPPDDTMSNQILPPAAPPAPGVCFPPQFFIKTPPACHCDGSPKTMGLWGYPVESPGGKFVTFPTDCPNSSQFPPIHIPSNCPRKSTVQSPAVFERQPRNHSERSGGKGEEISRESACGPLCD